jgi:hypothetical protein
LPPQVPQLTPQVVPLAHGAHATPPCPHDAASVPLSHVAPSQHPLHEVTSHLHTPATQRWPCPHAPSVHTPSHPFDAPHAALAHDGTHAPTPQTLGCPPPPQSRPIVQPPQSTNAPHESSKMPHLPLHVSACDGQSRPASVTIPASGAVASAPASLGALPDLNDAHAAATAAKRRTKRTRGIVFGKATRAYNAS